MQILTNYLEINNCTFSLSHCSLFVENVDEADIQNATFYIDYVYADGLFASNIKTIRIADSKFITTVPNGNAHIYLMREYVLLFNCALNTLFDIKPNTHNRGNKISFTNHQPFSAKNYNLFVIFPVSDFTSIQHHF